MPVVELHILEGYDAADKARLGTALTNAVRSVVPAAPDLVTVMIHEMPAADYYRGGQTRTPARSKPDPIEIVKTYLSAMEARDLETARSLLAPGFEMVFPGTQPMTTLEELIAWSAPRYKHVAKRFEGFETLQSHGEAAVVYCRGTLHGVDHDGRAFDAIRFVDRFEIVGDKLSRQDVWNDMAEKRAGALT